MEKFSRIITLTTALMLCSFFIYGQQLKTFVNKNYDGPNGGIGTLTYTYYEGSNGDYMKHGKFSINTTLDIPKTWSSQYRTHVWGTRKYSVSANYKDGWWNGVLTITASDNTMCTNKSYSGVFASTLTANFNNGVPHGIWKMTRTKNGTKTFSISANFSNGMLVGTFNLNDELVGQLDNNGFFTGKWKKKENSTTEREYNFINHVYVSMYERQDGKVVWSLPKTNFEKELYKEFAEGNISTDELMKYGYAIDTATDLVGTKFMWTILYEGQDGFALNEIDGDKTNEKNRPERVTMGKYISLKKVEDVIILQFEDENKFANFAQKIEKYLENELFEDTCTIKSAEELWAGYWLNQDQKKTMTSIYNKYVKEMLPGKLQRIEEEKRKAEEEERQKIELLQQREVERLKNHTDSIHAFIVNSGYKSLIDTYNNDVVNLITDIEDNQIKTSEKLDKQKALIKIQEAYLSFVDIEKQFAEHNEMLVKEGLSEFPDMIELYDYLKKNYKPQYSSNNVNEIKKKADSYIQMLKELMTLTKYRKAISDLNDVIMVASEPFSDIAKSYTDFRAANDLKVTHDFQKSTESFVSYYNMQHFYQRFIELRKSFAQKNVQINQNKQHEDVLNLYNDFVRDYDLSISQDTTESRNRLLSIIKTQDACLMFISLRDEIVNNNNLLPNNKTAKNIVKVYDTFMKSADLTWTPDLNCCDKLRKVIDIQNQLLTAIKAPNADELDKRVKKLKDNSLENVLKELK